jgi:hypothetical protein
MKGNNKRMESIGDYFVFDNKFNFVEMIKNECLKHGETLKGTKL